MTTRSARPFNLLVGCLVFAAMPGLAFGAVPATGAAPAPSAAAAEDPAPPAMPKPYAPPPASAPPAPNAAPTPSAAPRPYTPPPGAPPAAAPSPYPPPGSYPMAPPQGAPPAYYYPPPPPAAYFPTAQRLVWLDLQLADLRARHDDITFGGPIALMVTGTLVGITGLIVIPEPCDYYYDTYSTCEQRDDQAALGVMMFIGGAVAATIGTISSIIRGAKKRHLGNQIRSRESEAAALRGMPPMQPRVGFGPTHGGGSMSLALDF